MKMKRSKKIIAKIDCAEAASRFNDFMDNYLKGKAKDELRFHIAECRHCFDRFEFEQMLKSKISSLVEATTSTKEEDRQQLQNILSKIYPS
jgi:hypothetical protein